MKHLSHSFALPSFQSVFVLFLALSMTSLWSCSSFGGDGNGGGGGGGGILPTSNCLKNPGDNLQFQLLAGPEVEAPSKVSVFFKLEDKDGDPVPNLPEGSFSFYEEGLNDECPTLVSKDEADRKIVSDPQSFRYHTTLVLDLSGSVINGNLDQLKQAAISFTEVVMPDDLNSGYQMSVHWFDGQDQLNVLVMPTDNKDSIIAGINSINENISNDNSTDLFGAVIRSVNVTETILSSIGNNILTSGSIVIFTDGRDRAQRYSRNDALTSVSGASNLISFFTIGLGNEINPDDLRDIGKDGFKQASNLEELISTFTEVGQLVSDEANSFYRFEYCSPIRSGSAELTIQAKVSTIKKGVLTFTYSGAGFTGGCAL